MKIGILGGAFDPPHQGHVAVANLAKHFFDKVWVLPAYDHMHGKKMRSADHRLEMCKIAFSKFSDKIVISDFEIVHMINDGTLSLIQKLNQSFPDNTFSMIIGQDNADTIETWKNHEQLISSTPFFVSTRTGYSIKDSDVWYRKPPHQYYYIESPEISSTEIREKLAKKERPAGRDRDGSYLAGQLPRNKVRGLEGDRRSMIDDL